VAMSAIEIAMAPSDDPLSRRKIVSSSRNRRVRASCERTSVNPRMVKHANSPSFKSEREDNESAPSQIPQYVLHHITTDGCTSYALVTSAAAQSPVGLAEGPQGLAAFRNRKSAGSWGMPVLTRRRYLERRIAGMSFTATCMSARSINAWAYPSPSIDGDGVAGSIPAFIQGNIDTERRL
jgi:hypothetical protein